MFRIAFPKRAHPFNNAAAHAYVKATGAWRAMGNQIPEADCPITAIDRSQRVAAGTRHMRDYADAGIE